MTRIRTQDGFANVGAQSYSCNVCEYIKIKRPKKTDQHGLLRTYRTSPIPPPSEEPRLYKLKFVIIVYNKIEFYGKTVSCFLGTRQLGASSGIFLYCRYCFSCAAYPREANSFYSLIFTLFFFCYFNITFNVTFSKDVYFAFNLFVMTVDSYRYRSIAVIFFNIFNKNVLFNIIKAYMQKLYLKYVFFLILNIEY